MRPTAVADACALLTEIAEAVEALTPEEVIEFREAHEHFDGLRKIKQAVGLIEAELTKRFCDEGVEVTYENTLYYPARTKTREQWDGPAIASLCAARATDWYYDRETGEALPPAVITTKIVTAITRCLGGMAPSTAWRTTYLASEFGLDKSEIAKFRTSEPGNPTIKSRPLNTSEMAA